MGAEEYAALEATITKLTARAPHKLYILDRDRKERFKAELARHLVHDDDEHGHDADSYLEELLDEDGGDEIVVTDAYPRDAGMASGIYQALKAHRLSSGGALYYEVGEWDPEGIVAIAARKMDAQAAAALGHVFALPTYYHAGDDLLEIDEHLSACAPDSWILDALLGHEAEWMSQELIDEGEERRAELRQAIEESRAEGDTDRSKLERAEEQLSAPPPWFLTLSDGQLEQIAQYNLPERGKAPRLSNTVRPWAKPILEMFLRPNDPTNLQHIVAAYLLAR